MALEHISETISQTMETIDNKRQIRRQRAEDDGVFYDEQKENYMNVQQFFDAMVRNKEQVKQLYEEQTQLFESFLQTHEMGLEYPVTVDGEEKWLRVEQPEGQYIYNKKFELGVRKTPKNPAE